MRNDPDPLADRFFDKATDDSVDFEITFAAFLSTLALAYPVVTYPVISRVSAFTLLGVTLFRRVALASPFAPRDRLLFRTRPLIEIASTSTVICIFASWSYSVSEALKFDAAWVFALFSLIGLSALLVFQEIVFRDYAAWWHVKFVERLGDSERFGAFWLVFSAFSLKLSLAEKHKPLRERVRELRTEPQDYPLPDKDLQEIVSEEWPRLVFQITFVFLVFFGVPALGGYVIFGMVGILLGISVVLIHDHSCFLYVAYGNPSYEEFRKPAWTIGLWLVLYVGELVLVLPPLTAPLHAITLF